MTDCRHPLKVKYATKRDALAALHVMRHKLGARDLDAYFCDGHWHVGHNPARLRWRRLRGRRRVA